MPTAGEELWRQEITATCCTGEGAYFTSIEWQSNGAIRVGGFSRSFQTLIGLDFYVPGGFVMEFGEDGSLHWPAIIRTKGTVVNSFESRGERIVAAGADRIFFNLRQTGLLFWRAWVRKNWP